MSKSSSPQGCICTWTEWAKPQAEWAQWSTSRPNSLVDWPGLKLVQPMASWTRVYTRRGRPSWWRKVVEAIPPSRPAMSLGLPTHHLVSYRLSQVGGAPPWPYKYPPLVEIRTHTPLHGNSTCKALILSVVARHSLVESVVRL
jgi:hypothetical protein